MPKQIIFKIWSKISYVTGRLVRNYMLFIIHYCVFSIISLGGSRLNLKKPTGQSAWNDWNNGLSSPLITKQSGKRWVINYVSWCFKSKNVWLLGLLPFIVIIKTTETELGIPTLESSLTYTLF